MYKQAIEDPFGAGPAVAKALAPTDALKLSDPAAYDTRKMWSDTAGGATTGGIIGGLGGAGVGLVGEMLSQKKKKRPLSTMLYGGLLGGLGGAGVGAAGANWDRLFGDKEKPPPKIEVKPPTRGQKIIKNIKEEVEKRVDEGSQAAAKAVGEPFGESNPATIAALGGLGTGAVAAGIDTAGLLRKYRIGSADQLRLVTQKDPGFKANNPELTAHLLELQKQPTQDAFNAAYKEIAAGRPVNVRPTIGAESFAGVLPHYERSVASLAGRQQPGMKPVEDWIAHLRATDPHGPELVNAEHFKNSLKNDITKNPNLPAGYIEKRIAEEVAALSKRAPGASLDKFLHGDPRRWNVTATTMPPYIAKELVAEFRAKLPGLEKQYPDLKYLKGATDEKILEFIRAAKNRGAIPELPGKMIGAFNPREAMKTQLLEGSNPTRQYLGISGIPRNLGGWGRVGAATRFAGRYAIPAATAWALYHGATQNQAKTIPMSAAMAELMKEHPGLPGAPPSK